MTIQRLNAAADLRGLRHSDLINGLSFAALLQAPGAAGHDVPVWRAMSNLLQENWPDRGLPRHAWWAPRRSDLRALSIGSTTAGGNTAISTAAQAIASATRPQLILERAGAQRIEVSSVVDAVLPEWSGGTGYWVGEGGTVDDGGLTVGVATATPRTAGVTMTVSRRLVKQAAQIEAQLAAELQRLVRGTIEEQFIVGSGTSNKPLGLLNTPGVTAVAFAGAVPTYAELVAMLDGYYAADGDPDGATWFLNATDFADLLTVTVASGTGEYAAKIIGGSRFVLGVRVFLSNYVPAGRAILCNPANLACVYWQAPIVQVNPYASDINGDVRLTVLSDCNLTVQHRPQLVLGGA